MNPIKSKLKSLPINPGVYLFKNAKREILYVGKAKVLKNRVRSYFTQSHDLAPRTRQLVLNIADLEYIICDTETEALMLENNLIKKHQPRYNIMLRDDKNYQFIKIDYSTQIPQVYTTRKIENNSSRPALYKRGGANKLKSYKLQANRYFGPYTSGASVRQTLSLMRYVIPYCANSKIGERPCFYYHLSRCPGVCAGIISLEEYKKTISAIEKFLSGDLKRVAADLKREMGVAAKKRFFEKAARLRDQYRALLKMLEKQKIVSPKKETHDAVNIFVAGQLAAVTLFQVREGRLIGRENFILQNAKAESREEILKVFLERYYLEASDVPAEINVPYLTSKSSPKSERRMSRPLSNHGEGWGEARSDSKAPNLIIELNQLQKILSQKFNRRVIFTAPTRGRKRQLLKLAETNARDFLQTSSQNSAKEQAQLTKALFELKDKLHLPQLPLRIECFDISNIQGTSPTGSMVVFENGKAKKSDYKRFAIKTIETPNDFAMMEEMLTRRFGHAPGSPPHEEEREEVVDGNRKTNKTSPTPPHKEGQKRAWRLPDLIVVDGGRGQLNVALKVLKNSKLKIPALGLAKRLEEIYLPQLKSPLRLPQNSSALHLLQRVRDEAHRFAIAYHRKRRSKRLLET